MLLVVFFSGIHKTIFFLKKWMVWKSLDYNLLKNDNNLCLTLSFIYFWRKKNHNYVLMILFSSFVLIMFHYSNIDWIVSFLSFQNLSNLHIKLMVVLSLMRQQFSVWYFNDTICNMNFNVIMHVIFYRYIFLSSFIYRTWLIIN